MRRGILVAALLLSAVTVPGAEASYDPLPATVWVAERVSPHARQFSIHAYFQWNNRGGRVTVVTADVVRGRVQPTAAMTMESTANEAPVAYSGGTEYGCVAMSPCDLVTSRGIDWFAAVVPPDAPQPDRVYLAVSAHSITVELVDSPGWRLARTSLRARYALSSRADATGVRAYGEHVEHFGEATLAGGRRGSVAVGTPPCRHLHRFGGVREGAGTARLDGGARVATFDCRTHLSDLAAAAYGATTWRFSGDVAGVAMGPTRLVVIDL